MGTSSEQVCLHIGLTGIGSTTPALGTSFADLPLTYLSTKESHVQAWIIPALSPKTHHSLLKPHACMASTTTTLIIGWQHSYPTSSFFQLHVIKGGGGKSGTPQSRKLSFSSHCPSCIIVATSTCSIAFPHWRDIFPTEEKAGFLESYNCKEIINLRLMIKKSPGIYL